MGNKLLKCNYGCAWFWVIISQSKSFPGKHMNTLWQAFDNFQTESWDGWILWAWDRDRDNSTRLRYGHRRLLNQLDPVSVTRMKTTTNYLDIDWITSWTLHYVTLYFSSCGQFKPVWASLVCMTNRNSIACHITSSLDFDKGGCVIQIEWTKALCNDCQPVF